MAFQSGRNPSCRVLSVSVNWLKIFLTVLNLHMTNTDKVRFQLQNSNMMFRLGSNSNFPDVHCMHLQSQFVLRKIIIYRLL